MNYVAIYRALSAPPTDAMTVARGDDYAVHLHPGPLAVSYSTGLADPWSPVNTITLGQERREFPRGSYVIVATRKATANGSAWSAAKDRIAQLVAVLDLEFPGLAHEKVYEGLMLTPATPMHVTWEEGFQFSPRRSYAPSDVATSLQACLIACKRCPRMIRRASRWRHAGSSVRLTLRTRSIASFSTTRCWRSTRRSATSMFLTSWPGSFRTVCLPDYRPRTSRRG